MEFTEKYDVFNGLEVLDDDGSVVIRMHTGHATVQLESSGITIVEWKDGKVFLAPLTTSSLMTALRGTEGYRTYSDSNVSKYIRICHDEYDEFVYINIKHKTIEWTDRHNNTYRVDFRI